MWLKRAGNLAETVRWKPSFQALFVNICVLVAFTVPSDQGRGGLTGKLGLVPAGPVSWATQCFSKRWLQAETVLVCEEEMVQRSPQSLSEVFMILTNKNLVRHLFSVGDTGGFLSACVVRKWKYKSAVIQMDALEVGLLSTALDPHLSSPSVTRSLIVFSWQHCFGHRCVEHWGVLILRHWCMVSFFLSGPLCWEKCSSNTGNGTGELMCLESDCNTLSFPTQMSSSIRSSF